MKKFKKFFSVLLTLAMVLGMSVTAFAEDSYSDPVDPTVIKNVTGKQGDEGTITVDGLASDDVTVTAYQIIKAKYDGKDGLFSGYATTYTGEPAVNFTDKDGNLLKDIRDQINNLNYLNAVIPVAMDKTQNEEGYVQTANEIVASGDNFKAIFKNLPVGSYVIMISGTEANTYNPVIASIYYDVENLTDNVLQQGNVDLLGENAWAKRSDSPDVEKKIVEGENNETKKDSDDAKIGDVITYEVKIDPIPEYQGSYPVLSITDTLSGGLKLTNVDNIKVQVVTSDGNKSDLNPNFYTKTAVNDTKSLSINFVVDDGYHLNEFAKAKSHILITYQAKLTADGAEYNQNANENDVVLKYTNDSKIDKGDKPDTKDDKTYTYTFDLDIDGNITKKILTKTGDASEEDKKGLAGAEFTLYVSREDAEKTDGTGVLYENDALKANVWTNPIKSTSAGQLPIRGLAAGTYYLKETKAPVGYSINTHIYEIKIEVTEYDSAHDDKIKSWTVTVDGTSLNTFDVTYTTNDDGVEETKVILNGDDKVVVDGGTMVEGYDGEHANETEIKNTTLTSLPSTGGIGTTIFTIGGCAIMIIAAALFFASRRKSTK